MSLRALIFGFAIALLTVAIQATAQTADKSAAQTRSQEVQKFAASMLDDLVPPERQRALGLDTLSEKQRAGLVRLLFEQHQLGREEGEKTASELLSRAQRARPSTPEVIETKVDGEFEGWEGETVVKLMNGQIWKQVEFHYDYHYAYMPDVLIYRSGGGYKMKVEGVSRDVGVERLK